MKTLKWGNALGVLVPQKISRPLGLRPGLDVVISESEPGRMVLTWDPNSKQVDPDQIEIPFFR